MSVGAVGNDPSRYAGAVGVGGLRDDATRPAERRGAAGAAGTAGTAAGAAANAAVDAAVDVARLDAHSAVAVENRRAAINPARLALAAVDAEGVPASPRGIDLKL